VPEGSDKLSPKDATEDLHRQEEAPVLWSDPPLMIGRQAARRHDAVHVRMAHQKVCPHVWRMLKTPISAPRWRGSAATSRRVAALVCKSQVSRRALFR
jgi:hypothetical protein